MADETKMGTFTGERERERERGREGEREGEREREREREREKAKSSHISLYFVLLTRLSLIIPMSTFDE